MSESQFQDGPQAETFSSSPTLRRPKQFDLKRGLILLMPALVIVGITFFMLHPTGQELWGKLLYGSNEQVAAEALTEYGALLVNQQTIGVTSVDLLGKDATDEILSHIADLYRLEILNLDSSKISDEQLRHIAALPKLTSLSLIHTQISDEGMKHLVDLDTVQSLFLTDTKITDEGLKYVTEMEGLKILGLQSTNVTDEGMKELTKIPGLERLLIIDTPITDEGLMNLQGSPILKRIDVQGTKITRQGATRLREVFSQTRPADFPELTVFF